jgi:hypothetical protein
LLGLESVLHLQRLYEIEEVGQEEEQEWYLGSVH